jgi:hypothetical protein
LVQKDLPDSVVSDKCFEIPEKQKAKLEKENIKGPVQVFINIKQRNLTLCR